MRMRTMISKEELAAISERASVGDYNRSQGREAINRLVGEIMRIREKLDSFFDDDSGEVKKEDVKELEELRAFKKKILETVK